ncbi:MAG TPA: hypothetical protein VMD99_10800 [Terriglobales bacterium]|nr:hypothetical protein [Terriglobales bacterium]
MPIRYNRRFHSTNVGKYYQGIGYLTKRAMLFPSDIGDSLYDVGLRTKA